MRLDLDGNETISMPPGRGIICVLRVLNLIVVTSHPIDLASRKWPYV